MSARKVVRKRVKKAVPEKRARKMKPAIVPVKKMPRNEFEALVRLRKISAPSSKINICRAKPKRKKRKKYVYELRWKTQSGDWFSSPLQATSDRAAVRKVRQLIISERIRWKNHSIRVGRLMREIPFKNPPVKAFVD